MSDSEPERAGSSALASGEPAPAGEGAILVSACLLGVRCNHVGQASPSAAVQALAGSTRLVPVCPETMGGLPTPRPAAEVGADGRVRTEAGEEITDAYARGAEATVALARAMGIARAVLKARSPSCGCHEIYDGTFTRTRVAGEGVTARALRQAGVHVISEDDLGNGEAQSGIPD